MFALGCIQAMKCNRNTCPTGTGTHEPDLQRGLDPANKIFQKAKAVGQAAPEPTQATAGAQT